MKKCPACGVLNEDAALACAKCNGPLAAVKPVLAGPPKPTLWQKIAFWQKRPGAGPVTRPDVEKMFADQEAQFPKAPPPPYAQLGYCMLGLGAFFTLMWGLSSLLKIPFEANYLMPVAGVLAAIGGLLAYLKPELGRTNYFVLIGKILVILYVFGAVVLASVSFASRALPPGQAIKILALAFPILPIGAWAVVAGPDPRDVHPEAFFGRGFVAAYGLISAIAFALYATDKNLLPWNDFFQVLQIGGFVFLAGVLGLIVDIVRSPHPTRG
ncbi:MAG: hypothetical protein AAB215_05320 [Planctomycetota bacterium]|mgnify:CR=1 FL=1